MMYHVSRPLTSPERTDIASPLDFLSIDPPRISSFDAERIADVHFGIRGTATALTSERDRNFLMEAGAAGRFVLKITNEAEPEGVTDFQTGALLHVAKRNPDLPVPRIFHTVDGDTRLRLSSGDGDATHAVRLMSFLPGCARHLTVRTAAQRRNVGRCLAALDLALADFDHPHAGHELAWDITHVARLRPLLSYIDETERRRLAEDALDRFERGAMPVLGKLRAQVIHNDLNPHNVLTDETSPNAITGLLDFGDMVRAPLVNEVAVAASYEPAPPEDPLGAIAGFVAAYHSAIPLTRDELSVVTDLVAARHVATVAITGRRAALYPENRTYILRNNLAAWEGLKVLAGVGRERATDILAAACAEGSSQ